MKTFTLDEAQAMLPLVEKLLNRAIESKQAAQGIDEELTNLARRIHMAGGMRVDVAKVAGRRSELHKLIERAREDVAGDRRDRRSDQRPGCGSAGLSLPHGRRDRAALLEVRRGFH